jgi:tight adherence protein B
MAPLLMALGVFMAGAALIFGAYLLLAGMPQWMMQRKIQARIDDVAFAFKPEPADMAATLVKGQVKGALPALDRVGQGTAAHSWLVRLIDQSGAKVGVSTVILSALGLGAAAAFGLAAILREPIALVPGFGLGAAIPFVVLLRKRTVRIRRFEEQFPEALDTLSRAIKAGHAFTTAMGMVADEGQDPIGPEFRKTFDEQNFGLPLKDALNNLATRVGLLDVRFFVTAVLIQRETGGNLSEILENLAYVVRERFKILRQVRVYTAHGRMTGYVLLALPAALAVALKFINPEHMDLLFTERMGRLMLCGVVVMQTFGYLWIRKIVDIEV